MKVKKSFLILTVIITFSGVVGFKILNPDQNTLDILIDNFYRFQQEYTAEKIYLVTNKPYYTSGDTLWYKAYLLDGQQYNPTSKSKILYVTLLNPSSQVIAYQQLKVDRGIAHAHIVLPDTLQTSSYLLTANTVWNKNFDGKNGFLKEIKILNSDNHEPSQQMAIRDFTFEEGDRLSFQFYPEGGSLVTGLTSKVAFKAINNLDKILSIKGTIKDDQGKTVTSFESGSEGIGAFIFKPEQNRSYSAKVVINENELQNIDFPEIKQDGMVLMTIPQQDLLKITLQSTTDFAKNNSKAFIVLRSRGKLFYTATIDLSKKQDALVNIPTTDLPSGMSQVVLFNALGKVEAERLVYIDNYNIPQIAITTDQKKYGRREKVTFSIQLTNEALSEANLSVSVKEKKLFPEDSLKGNIVSHLLLGSEIESSLNNPHFFLSSNDRTKSLDLMLLTENYSRPSWGEIFEKARVKPKYQPEKYLSLKGKAVNIETGLPPDSLFIIFYLVNQGQLYETHMLEDGSFYFPLLFDYFGSQRLLIHTPFSDNKDITITLSEAQRHERTGIPYAYSDRIDNSEMIEYLAFKNKLKMVEKSYDFYADYYSENPEIRYAAAYSSVSSEKVEFKQLHTKTDLTIHLEEYVRFPNMREVFRELVHGVMVRDKKDGFELRIYSKELNEKYGSQPLILLDGLPIRDLNFLLNLDPGKLSKIDVLSSYDNWVNYGYAGMNGVLALYSKEGNIVDTSHEKSSYTVEGFYKGNEFFLPKWENNTTTVLRVPDLRPFLYWNPDVNLVDGNAQLSFYASDYQGTYTIELEGITSDGLPFVSSSTFEVVHQGPN